MFVTAKKILKDAKFKLHKFYSSLGTLQARVSPLGHPQETLPTEELEESYTSSTLIWEGAQVAFGRAEGAGDAVEHVG